MAANRSWTNADRARSAKRACETFARITGQDIGEEFRTVIQDLVTNLMHLVHEDGGDAYDLVRAASDHFQAEYNEEEWGEDE